MMQGNKPQYAIRIVAVITVFAALALLVCAKLVIAPTAKGTEIERRLFEVSDGTLIVADAPELDGSFNFQFDGLKAGDSVELRYNDFVRTDDFSQSILKLRNLPIPDSKLPAYGDLIVKLSDAMDASRQLAIVVSPQTMGNWTDNALVRTALAHELTGYSEAQYSGTQCFSIDGTEQSIMGSNNIFAESHPYYTGAYMKSGYVLWDPNSMVKRLFTGFGGQCEEFGLYYSAGNIGVSYENGARVNTANIESVDFLSTSSKFLGETPYETRYQPSFVRDYFRSGYAKLSLEFTSVVGSSFELLLSEIGGMRLSDVVKDSETKAIFADIDHNGVAGVAYDIPEGRALAFDGADVSEELAVSVEDPTGASIPTQNGTFIPQLAGVHKLNYQLQDQMRTFSVDVFAEMPTAAIAPTGTFLAAYRTGATIKIPKATVTNSLSRRFGKAADYTILLQNGNETVTAYENSTEDHFYRLTASGEYRAVYAAVNAFGIVDTKMYTFIVTGELVIDVAPPISVKKGFVADLSRFTIDGFGQIDDKDIYSAVYVDGARVYLGKGNVAISGSLEYRVPKEYSRVALDVSYRAGTTEDTVDCRTDVAVPVYDPVYMTDYIIPYHPTTGTYDGDIQVSATPNESVYTVAEDMGLMFANIVPTAELELRFRVPQTHADVERLTILLQDSIDASQRIELKIAKQSETHSLLVVNGIGAYSIKGSFGNDESMFWLTFDGLTNRLLDEQGAAIGGNINKTNAGLPFDGFSSGFASVRFELGGVGSGGGSLAILKICNQSFGSDFIGEAIQPLSDFAEPILCFSEDMSGGMVEQGGDIVVAKAVAYDMLEGLSDARVTVKRPDGTIAYEGSCAQSVRIVADAYGDWLVIYHYQDSGNTATKTFVFTVQDETAPYIIIDVDIKREYAVGEKIKIPSARVFDNLDEECHVYAALLLPSGRRVAVDQKAVYTLEAKGTYTLIFYAYDEAFNFAQRTFEITVG